VIHTPVCDLLGIRHPIVLGGMARATSVPLVAAVSNAGGLGTLGLGRTPADQVPKQIAAIRDATRQPFGVNFLLFLASDAAIDAALAARPPVLAAAWARPDQDLRALFRRAHDAGSIVMYQAGTVPEARRATGAGADVIVAQGTEGGGHVGWMATMTLLPMIVDAVGSAPVLAAGGIADGRGLAAALALGAHGALVGTRFLATQESPLHPNFKQAIVDSDGHDTVLTEIPDIAVANVWPGAMARCRRNGFIERWAGREWELRAHQAEAAAALERARESGDADSASLLIGQDAGLIHDIPRAGEIVERIVDEAERVLKDRLPKLVRANGDPRRPEGLFADERPEVT
jgi:NAD(P)H-dependent flavin oxidoreductase YrpB (nitropropane dioxygenase family)